MASVHHIIRSTSYVGRGQCQGAPCRGARTMAATLRSQAPRRGAPARRGARAPRAARACARAAAAGSASYDALAGVEVCHAASGELRELRSEWVRTAASQSIATPHARANPACQTAQAPKRGQPASGYWLGGGGFSLGFLRACCIL